MVKRRREEKGKRGREEERKRGRAEEREGQRERGSVREREREPEREREGKKESPDDHVRSTRLAVRQERRRTSGRSSIIITTYDVRWYKIIQYRMCTYNTHNIITSWFINISYYNQPAGRASGRPAG